MSQGSGVREVLDEIRAALSGRSDEVLREVLAYVFKEYVVEGRGLSPKTAAILDAKSELAGMSFVELVRWMQLHLDVPELAQLEIEGTRVVLKSGAQRVAIESVQSRPEPLPAAPPVAAPAPVASPVPAPAPVAAAPAPRPPAPAPTPAPAPPAAAQPAKPAAAPAAPAEEKPAASDENAKRFSLLEVD